MVAVEATVAVFCGASGRDLDGPVVFCEFLGVCVLGRGTGALTAGNTTEATCFCGSDSRVTRTGAATRTTGSDWRVAETDAGFATAGFEIRRAGGDGVSD